MFFVHPITRESANAILAIWMVMSLSLNSESIELDPLPAFLPNHAELIGSVHHHALCLLIVVFPKQKKKKTSMPQNKVVALWALQVGRFSFIELWAHYKLLGSVDTNGHSRGEIFPEIA
jgi:hypothetical protein